MLLSCPACQASLDLPEAEPGLEVCCGSCHGRFQVALGSAECAQSPAPIRLDPIGTPAAAEGLPSPGRPAASGVLRITACGPRSADLAAVDTSALLPGGPAFPSASVGTSFGPGPATTAGSGQSMVIAPGSAPALEVHTAEPLTPEVFGASTPPRSMTDALPDAGNHASSFQLSVAAAPSGDLAGPIQFAVAGPPIAALVPDVLAAGAEPGMPQPPGSAEADEDPGFQDLAPAPGRRPHERVDPTIEEVPALRAGTTILLTCLIFGLFLIGWRRWLWSRSRDHHADRLLWAIAAVGAVLILAVLVQLGRKLWRAQHAAAAGASRVDSHDRLDTRLAELKSWDGPGQASRGGAAEPGDR